MKYSRFDESRGIYDVFEDNLTHPLNDDLPIPRLGSDAGSIGVSAREAGRDLPGGARPAGVSWLPVGQVVRSARSPLGAMAPETERKLKLAAVLGGSAVAGYWLWRTYVRSMRGLGGAY